MTETGSTASTENIERRRFLKRAATVAWATPVMMTVLSSRAGAQVPLIGCGTAVGQNPCPNTPACPTPLPVCRKRLPGELGAVGNECFCFAS